MYAYFHEIDKITVKCLYFHILLLYLRKLNCSIMTTNDILDKLKPVLKGKVKSIGVSGGVELPYRIEVMYDNNVTAEFKGYSFESIIDSITNSDDSIHFTADKALDVTLASDRVKLELDTVLKKIEKHASGGHTFILEAIAGGTGRALSNMGYSVSLYQVDSAEVIISW